MKVVDGENTGLAACLRLHKNTFFQFLSSNSLLLRCEQRPIVSAQQEESLLLVWRGEREKRRDNIY